MKLLSPEEIDELRQHPAVLKVNEYFLHLTPEFKEWFYEEFQKGKPAKTILMEAGFNIDIIKTRIRSIRAHVLKWKAEQLNIDPAKVTPPSIYELTAARAKIGRLEQQLKRSQQELEFVKKIINAGKEG